MARYPRDLAALIHKRLTSEKLTPPAVDVLARLVEVMYFASLRTEEAHYVRCWISYVDPDNPDPHRPMFVRPHRWTITRLSTRIAFSERNIAKLGPAADPWSTAIAVFSDTKGKLFIWGLIDQGIHKSRILVREPSGGGFPFCGLFELVIQGPAELVAYRDDALIGRLRQDVLITREHDVLWNGPVYKKLRPAIANLQRRVTRAIPPDLYDRALFSSETAEEEWLSTLSRFLIAVQRYRHGGAILISKTTRDLHFKYSLPYDRVKELLFEYTKHAILTGAFRQLISDDFLETGRKTLPMSVYLDSEVAEGTEEDFRDALTGAVHFLGSLTRVDGLMHFFPDLRCSGFGAEIRIESDPERVFMAAASDPRRNDLTELDPAHFGMRHRSMMRYCARHEEAVGFVVSQDGDIRAMTSVDNDLLVWENVMVLYLRREYWARLSQRYKLGEKQRASEERVSGA